MRTAAGEREAAVLSLTDLQKLRLEQPFLPQGMQAWWVGGRPDTLKIWHDLPQNNDGLPSFLKSLMPISKLIPSSYLQAFQ